MNDLFENVALRVNGNRLALAAVAPPFQTACWARADSALAELGLTDVAPAQLLRSPQARSRLLSALAERGGAASIFGPQTVGFRASEREVRLRGLFRQGRGLVKFLGKCPREVALGALSAAFGRIATGARIEARFCGWDGPSAGGEARELLAEVCALLAGAGRCGGPQILFSDLLEPDPGLWEFIYQRPLIRIGWEASELLTCGGGGNLEHRCLSSPGLNNLREISEAGLWPHVVLPVSAANVGALPELVAGLIELTRGATVEVTPVCFMPSLAGRAEAPLAEDYAAALLEIYMEPDLPLKLVSPLSWVAERIEAEMPMIRSAASVGAETVVLPNGEMYASEFGVGMERWRIGNALEESSNLRWERLDMMAETFSNAMQPERCQTCDWRYRCGGLDASVFLLQERAGGQRSEVRGQRSEVRGQRPEVRGRRTEVRGQRSEVRGRGQTARKPSRSGRGGTGPGGALLRAAEGAV